MDRAAEKKKEARKGGAARKKAGRKQRDPSESDGDSGQDRSAAASPDYIAASDKDSDEQLSTADGGTKADPIKPPIGSSNEESSHGKSTATSFRPPWF